MIKLLDVLEEILTEKKLCPKGRAYRRRRLAAGEKHSAYLSGRAVQVCNGRLKEEDDLDEGLEDTSWTNGEDKTVTLKQLLDAIKDYPTIEAPIEKVKKISLKPNGDGIEPDRVSNADITYPIIIVVDNNGNYKHVLDGNHRANKAIDAGLKFIPAKLVNIKKLPQEFQDVLGESLRDWFKKEDWVRIDTAGNITGPCGTMKKGNKTTRCLPRNKANSLTKDERAATSRKKAASEKQFVPNTKKAKVKLKELRQIINDIINELLHSNEDNIDESTLEGDDVNTKWYIVWPDGRYVHENELYQRPSDARPAGDDPMTPWYEVDAHYHGKFHPWAGSYHIQATSLDNAVEYAKSSPKLKVTDDEESIEEYDVESEQDVKEFVQFMREYNQPLCEAEYHGRKVNLGKPMQGDVKKFKVYVKNPKGKVVKVNFGFGGSSAKGKRMTIKKNNPKRRKSFRARHNCDNPGPRTKARYWSCRAW